MYQNGNQDHRPWEPACRYLSGHTNTIREGSWADPFKCYLCCLCSAETRAEASSSKPPLIHTYAGRGHSGQSAQVPSAGHRHGRKPEADRPVLTEGCPGREGDQRLISISAQWLLLKENGLVWSCPRAGCQRPQGRGQATSSALGGLQSVPAFDLGHCKEKGWRTVVKTSEHWRPSNLCVFSLRPLFRWPPPELQKGVR